MTIRIIEGDVREKLREIEPESVQCVVTSPPYWALRDYGVAGQFGLEESPSAYVVALVEIMREVRRVLKKDGTLWMNLGDKYVAGRTGGVGKTSIRGGRRNMGAARAAQAATRDRRAHTVVRGLKPKDLIGIPWRAAFALQEDGWWLRSDIIWAKPNPTPESVLDRPTRSHEYMFLLSKSRRYFYDADSIRTPLTPKTFTTHGSTRKSKGTDALGRVAAHNLSRDVPDRKPKLSESGEVLGANRRDVWTLDEIEVPTVWTLSNEPYPHSHFATFPRALVEPCVLAGSRPGDVVLDIFAGSGTTLEVATSLGREAWGIELNPDYIPLIRRRLAGTQLRLLEAK